MPNVPLDPLGVDRLLSDPERLDALDATALVGGPPDAALDRLTRLVRRCLRVPVALVSLVDDVRQVFVSQQGLAEPWCSVGETPLSHSFCKHVVALDAPLVVEDAREHPTVRDNLAIREMGVVAYLGVPLRAPGGEVLGSLCAIDSVPRAWTDADREVMDGLAEVAMGQIATRIRTQAETDALWDTLARSGALFRAVFESVAEPLGVLHPAGTVIDANPPLLRLLGLSREEAVGRPLEALLPVPSGDGACVHDAVQRAADGDAVRLADVLRGEGLGLRVRHVEGAKGLLLIDVPSE